MKFTMQIHTDGTSTFQDEFVRLDVPELETREQVQKYAFEYVKKLNDEKSADQPIKKLFGIDKIWSSNLS